MDHLRNDSAEDAGFAAGGVRDAPQPDRAAPARANANSHRMGTSIVVSTRLTRAGSRALQAFAGHGTERPLIGGAACLNAESVLSLSEGLAAQAAYPGYRWPRFA